MKQKFTKLSKYFFNYFRMQTILVYISDLKSICYKISKLLRNHCVLVCKLKKEKNYKIQPIKKIEKHERSPKMKKQSKFREWNSATLTSKRGTKHHLI